MKNKNVSALRGSAEAETTDGTDGQTVDGRPAAVNSLTIREISVISG